MTKRIVVGYARVSTKEQADNGLSLEHQERSVRAFAAARDEEIAAFYVDRGVSGLKAPGKRPQFAHLLDHLAAHPKVKATIVVYRLDRVGRNAREVLALEHRLRLHGAKLASVSESFDSSTAGGKAFLGLASVFAEYESGIIGERTYVTMHSGVTEESARVGGVPPIGYKADERGMYVPEPSEAITVAVLFTTYIQTRSFNATARELNGRGLRTKAGRAWSHATVADVVRNVGVYGGTRTWGRRSRRDGPREQRTWRVVDNAHPALLSAGVVELVRGILP